MFNSVLCLFIIIVLSLIFAQQTFAQESGGEHQSPDNVTVSAVMETVVVTAEQLSEYVKNHPQNVVVLERREIEKQNYLDITEAIDSMPGVEVRKSGGGMQTRISIRGSPGSGGVLILINGRPVASGQYGGVELGSLPIETVRRVIVFKPPVPVWLGPGAIAGAINIETDYIEKPEDDDKEKNIQLKATAGSFGAISAGATYGMVLYDSNLTISAGGGHRDGKRPNSDRDSGYLSVKWHKTTPGFITYDLNSYYYYTESGSAGPTYNPTPDARQRYHKGTIDVSVKGILNETNDFSLKSYADMVGVKDVSQAGTTSQLEALSFGLKGETVRAETGSSHVLRLGGLIEGNTVDHTISGKHHRSKVSVHTQFDKDSESVTTSLGLRGDYISDFGLFPAFTSGLSYVINSQKLIKANAGYSVKVPAFGQLYQPVHGSIDHVRGNPDLQEEKVWSYDFGIEHTLGEGNVFQATIFRSDHRNLIAYRKGIDLISRPVNVPTAYRQGVELMLKYSFNEKMRVDINYTYQKSKIRDTGGELAYTPRQKVKVSFKYTLPVWQTRCEAILRAMDRQFSDTENKPSEELAGYTTMDIRIIQPLNDIYKSAEMYANFKNLFDADFESHYGYPDEGFRFNAGMNVKF